MSSSSDPSLFNLDTSNHSLESSFNLDILDQRSSEVVLPEIPSPASAFAPFNGQVTSGKPTSIASEKSTESSSSEDVFKILFSESDSETEDGEIKETPKKHPGEPEVQNSPILKVLEERKRGSAFINKWFEKDLNPPNYELERHLRGLYEKLAFHTRQREEVRSTIASVIKDYDILSKRERQILEDGYDEERQFVDRTGPRLILPRKRQAGVDWKPTKNFLAEGDKFRFVVQCPSGETSAGARYVEGKVRRIAGKGIFEGKEHLVTASPSYPVLVDVTFVENPDIHPIFGKKGKRHLVLEGLEKVVKFN